MNLKIGKSYVYYDKKIEGKINNPIIIIRSFLDTYHFLKHIYYDIVTDQFGSFYDNSIYCSKLIETSQNKYFSNLTPLFKEQLMLYYMGPTYDS